MGDLIIKPASSGSLKIQDQAGTDFITTGTSSGLTLDSGVTFPTDHIIQVKSTTKTDKTSRVNSNTSTDYADISGMSVSITPKSNSKVFVFAMLSITVTAAYMMSYRLVRDSTPICIGDQGTSAQARPTGATRGFNQYVAISLPISFLDTSPGGDGSTSLAYKVQWDGENGGTMYLNHPQTEVDRYDFGITASTISVMEIAG